jgi:hypothetical protein
LLRVSGSDGICAGFAVDGYTGDVLSVAPILRHWFEGRSAGDALVAMLQIGLELEPEVIAALRHSVVRHRVTLTAHWRDLIGSVELVERVRAE